MHPGYEYNYYEKKGYLYFVLNKYYFKLLFQVNRNKIMNKQIKNLQLKFKMII